MSASKYETAQSGVDLLGDLGGEGQNLCHVVELTELAEGVGLGHLHPLGQGVSSCLDCMR